MDRFIYHLDHMVIGKVNSLFNIIKKINVNKNKMYITNINSWEESGFRKREAVLWFTKGFDLKSAKKWKKRGFTVGSAFHYRNSGYNPDTAKEMIISELQSELRLRSVLPF